MVVVKWNEIRKHNRLIFYLSSLVSHFFFFFFIYLAGRPNSKYSTCCLLLVVVVWWLWSLKLWTKTNEENLKKKVQMRMMYILPPYALPTSEYLAFFIIAEISHFFQKSRRPVRRLLNSLPVTCWWWSSSSSYFVDFTFCFFSLLFFFFFFVAFYSKNIL